MKPRARQAAAFFTVLFAALVFAACATPPGVPAPWAQTPRSLREVFPDADYIAQRGRGKTRKAAEANAAAEIARYITSQINTQAGVRMTATQINGVGAEKLEVINEQIVKTQIDLFGIRYADGAFFDGGEWQACAYIEREEAWRIYAPRIKTQGDSFLNLYTAAEKEDDAFKKVLRYNAALAYSQKDDFANTQIFGQIIYPQKMNAEFAPVRASLAALPQKIDGAKRNATVYIECNTDFENRITNELSQQFSAQGFAVAKTRKDAAAVCAVTINEGEQKRELGIFYNPSLSAELRGKSGVLASFSMQGAQAQAVTPDVAKRRAYTSLAESVKANFASRFAIKI